MASVLGALRDSSLSRRLDLHLFETGKTTPENRPLWQGIAARLQLLLRWWKEMGRTPRPIAHIHTCSGFTFFLDGLLLLLAKARSARIILHIHGGRFDTFLDRLNFAEAIFARWLAQRADSVIVLSNDWHKRLSHRLPGAKIEVVPNGVPSLAGSVFPKAKASATPRFIFLGTLSKGRGISVVLHAASQSKTPWNLDLAGAEDTPGFMAWTREEIARLGLADRIKVLGPVVGEAKTRLLLEADGFVLPSLAEGLPMALLEAMAAGLPVVVTTVGAVPEVVRDGIEGYLVPPDNATALREALDRLASSAEVRDSMGKAARKSCERGYGIERMVDALIEIYTTVQTDRPR